MCTPFLGDRTWFIISKELMRMLFGIMPIMFFGPWRIILVVSYLTVASCATAHDGGEGTAGSVPPITFAQVKATPESFKGQSVVFGGEVLTARRLKDGTRIEILQLPLDRSSRPGTNLTQSQGRFMAIHRDFLDPATLPYGTSVTVTGEVTGSITMPLDESDYTYPVIDIKNLQVWAGFDDSVPRMRPYYGPGPYWGPYWRPWPYW
jgi:outer membrane lipoprotein